MKQVETQHTKPFRMNPKLNQEAKLTETSTCIRYGGKTQVNNAMIQIELEKQEQNKPRLRREVTDQRRHKQNEENRKDK